MKLLLLSLASTEMASSKRKEVKVETRPRSAKMDKFMSQVNGSPHYNIANVAAQVSQALAQSKQIA